ncbi:MAG: VOC family protein [Acidobacteriaceae bacterium]
MRINPYLLFNGQCEQAFTFYQQILGGKIEAMLPHEGTPAEGHVPAEWLKKIMHARLVIDGQPLMGSDAPPEHYNQPKGFSVSLDVNDPAKAERIFNALAEKGSVQMPFAQTFWAHRFGMTTDQFGIPWMINCEKAA